MNIYYSLPGNLLLTQMKKLKLDGHVNLSQQHKKSYKQNQLTMLETKM